MYYNDNDASAAAWLAELIKQGRLPYGDVDGKGIEDVTKADVEKYTQCHFFAGIGGWPYALRLAGWPSDRPVWTGSCPCQPFSTAGKRLGERDERHLWPEFRRLIAECGPPTVIGEQVASPAGREWLAGVRSDLEALGYAVGAADLCAAGVGAPHIRQRLFWVAYADFDGPQGRLRRREDTEREDQRGSSGSGGADSGTTRSAWGETELVPCGDGRNRRVKPGLEPLAHGVPGRVGLLRGYGNAIVPQIAAEFVKAFMETEL